MPITRPVTKTIISTTQWGIPITDEVNALRTELDALRPTVWTNVTLQNGWTNVGGQQAMQYRKIGDVVYLRGLIGGGTIPSIFGLLPVGFRPPVSLSFAIRCWTGSADAIACVNIYTNGNLEFASGFNQFAAPNILFSITA